MTGLKTDEIGNAAGDVGVILHELSEQSMTLEQVYLELTGESLDYSSSPSESDDGQ